MNDQTILIIIGLINFCILARVIWIQNQQTKSQNEIVRNMKTYSDFMKEYTSIFDMELVKKYVSNERIIMSQDTEIIRRKVIKDTTQKVSDEFTNKIEQMMPEKTYTLMNDMGTFIAWWFTNYMTERDTSIEEYVKSMFPNSHESILGYIEHFQATTRNSKKP
jgi:hypothetical protein